MIGSMATKLKRVYTKIDDIPEADRGIYAENGDGKWILDREFEGLVPASKLDKFRTTNTKDRERFEAELKKFEGIDPERYHQLAARAEELDQHKLIKKGDVDTVIAQKVDAQIKPLREEIQKREDRIGALRAKLQKATLETQILQEAGPIMKKTAGPDIVRRLLDVFRMDETDTIRAYAEDGKTPRYNGSTGEPYSIADGIEELRKGTGAHLFEENAGHGSDIPRGGGGVGSFSGPNPFEQKTYNRTQIGMLVKNNYALALQLARKAGHPEPKKPTV